MEQRLLIFIANTNNFTLLYKQVRSDGKSFNFCRLPFAVNVMLNHSNDVLIPSGYNILAVLILKSIPRRGFNLLFCSPPSKTALSSLPYNQ